MFGVGLHFSIGDLLRVRNIAIPGAIIQVTLATGLGTAIGLALRGYRPVVEIQFDGFVFPAYDQIVTQLAKMHARALGKVKLPVVVRIPYGGGIGAVEHHSESPEALFAHVAGLKVVSPSNASDAYWMMQQAIQSDDPVIFFEPKRRYWDKGEVDTEAIPGPLHTARVARAGTDITLAAYGPMVMVGWGGIYAEVLDDAALAPAPITPATARDLLERLRGYRLLTGVRGEPPRDIAAVVEFLVRLSHLAWDARATLAELDVNPLFVHEAGAGVTVVDALAVKIEKN